MQTKSNLSGNSQLARFGLMAMYGLYAQCLRIGFLVALFIKVKRKRSVEQSQTFKRS